MLHNNAYSDNQYSYKKTLEDLGTKYEAFLDGYLGILTTTENIIQRITGTIKKYTGEDGDIFSFANCNFVGKNIKIVLKYLKSCLAEDLYTVGICLLVVGTSLIFSISFTILLIIIINKALEEEKQKQNNKLMN